MKQVRLSKQNIAKLEELGFLTSDEMNIRIGILLSSDVHGCTQQNNDSIIPLLVRLVEAQESIALSAGRVGQRTLNESSEKKNQSVQNIVKQQIVTRNNYYRDEDLPIEEQYGRPKKPVHRTLSPAQQDWVLDLVRKTINSISPDGDWDSPTGSTRNIQLVYNLLKGPVDLYDQYKIYMYEWILDNWEHKAELFKF